MKKRSKVFLIISACIAALGIAVCLIAAGIASSRGEKLFPESIGDGNGYIHSFDSEKISCITVDVCNAKVNVIGNADISRVEIINFDENLYSFSKSDAIISLKESKDMSSAFNLFEGGLDFKGLRYFFWSGADSDNKTVNIYLDKNSSIKTLDISADEGEVSLRDLSCNTAYSVSLGKGAVSAENITDASQMSIEIEKGDSAKLSLNKVWSEHIDISASNADIKSTMLSAFDCNISVNSGSIFLDSYTISAKLYDINIRSTGKITVGDADYTDSCTLTHDEEAEEKDEYGQIKEGTLGKLTISANDAPITISELSEE